MLRVIAVAAALVALTSCASSQAERSAAPAAPMASVLDDFPTAPKALPLPTGPLQLIAIGSCSNEEFNRGQEAFERIAAHKPDLMIFLGDNVYGSGTPEDPQLSELRASYWQQARRREFSALASSVPRLSVWDDHDFGKNDAGGDFTGKALALQMFRAFWGISATSPQNHPDGVYGAYQIGPQGQRVQILLLDTRFNRSPLKPTDQRNAPGKERYLEDSTPGLTVLGAPQWAWLEQQLRQPADLRIIVSSIQVVSLGHGWEKWGNFPPERARLFGLIRETGAKGVVVLSGDRHYGSIAREPAGPNAAPYPIYDFTSSAINMPWTGGVEEAVPNRITPPIGQENFGLVRIDWTGRTVTLEARDKQDAVVFTQAVPFGEIGL